MPPDMQMPSVRTTTARNEKNTEQRASVHTIENHTTQRAKITHTSSRRIQYFTRAERVITRRDERRARRARALGSSLQQSPRTRTPTDHSVLITSPSTTPRAHATARAHTRPRTPIHHPPIHPSHRIDHRRTANARAPLPSPGTVNRTGTTPPWSTTSPRGRHRARMADASRRAGRWVMARQRGGRS